MPPKVNSQPIDVIKMKNMKKQIPNFSVIALLNDIDQIPEIHYSPFAQ